MQVLAKSPQVQQRVHHELTRAVERDLTAALGAEEGERGRARVKEQVRLGGARAQGVHGGVLQQEDGARNATCSMGGWVSDR